MCDSYRVDSEVTIHVIGREAKVLRTFESNYLEIQNVWLMLWSASDMSKIPGWRVHVTAYPHDTKTK